MKLLGSTITSYHKYVLTKSANPRAYRLQQAARAHKQDPMPTTLNNPFQFISHRTAPNKHFSQGRRGSSHSNISPQYFVTPSPRLRFHPSVSCTQSQFIKENIGIGRLKHQINYCETVKRQVNAKFCHCCIYVMVYYLRCELFIIVYVLNAQVSPQAAFAKG